jgi:hypothetical protein
MGIPVRCRTVTLDVLNKNEPAIYRCKRIPVSSWTGRLYIGILADPLTFASRSHYNQDTNNKSSKGAYSPGWEGLKAKPVKVRRCRATVIRLVR